MDIQPVVLIIMGLTALVTYQGLNDYSFFSKYNFDIYGVKQGQFWRYFTSGFLHVDWQHFIFNMITLYFFGNNVVAVVGPLYFILIYIVSLLAGNVLTYQLYLNDLNYRAVGASGAIMGILYAFVIMFPTQTIYLLIIPIPGFVFAIGYLLYSIYGMRKRMDNIGHAAHFGGAIGGLLLILLKFPELLQERLYLIGILLIPILLLIVMAKRGKI
ncbi:MAG: rhomboid family intramembrane serine protease [Flavobacteriaceae bacterium]|jgi:membrane associated rhomboid family serine protease|nr:rhomboid family intramembrane serine protease [Flavobacteriaceae bacterium]